MIAAPQSVAVFRALQLGDMLCSVPALRALRSAWPQARLTLVGLPWSRLFVERYGGLIDDLEVFPGAPGFPEQDESGSGLADFFARMQAHRFDLAIQLHGSGGPANDIVCRFGARHCAGFLQPGEQRTGTFLPWPDAVREPLRYLLLVRRLGIDARDEKLWMPLERSDHDACEQLLAQCNVTAPFVVLHPGAQLPSRRWPVGRFAAVADALIAERRTVVVTGSANEADIVRALAARMTGEAVDLTGRTSLGALAALIARSALVVCNDTGVSHVAAAMGTPSVVIACGSDTRRWAPADAALHRVLAKYPACRPCGHPVCPYSHECAREISVAEVLDAVRAQFQASPLPSPASGRGRARLRRSPTD